MDIIRNRLTNNIIILRPDQHICPRCKGEGVSSELDDSYYEPDGEFVYSECYLCEGDGFLDWVRFLFIGDWRTKEAEDTIERILEDESDDYIYECYMEHEDQENGSFIVDK